MPIQLTDAPTVSDQIPRRKKADGGEGGPLVIPPGAQHISGTKRCDTCGRMVERVKPAHRKGTCKCMFYQRTTTFIDVLQDEYLLKRWGNRNVAWGVAQRPDLQLLASSCARPSEILSGSEDYRALNEVVDEAQREAGDKIKATIGTSLHKLTHQIDRGETLGKIPERWRDDIKAYEEWKKTAELQWVSIESFRVGDWWVKPYGTGRKECDHKQIRFGGNCTCYGVAGTVDRIAWYRGRLVILDLKTGSDFNELGHAMQLAAYAHMVPYEFPGDTRTSDPEPGVNLDVGYVIYLPEGQGVVSMRALDLRKGWAACELAKQVWAARKWDVVLGEEDEWDTLWRLTTTCSTLKALNHFRRVWKEDGRLTPELYEVMKQHAKDLRTQGVTA